MLHRATSPRFKRLLLLLTPLVLLVITVAGLLLMQKRVTEQRSPEVVKVLPSRAHILAETSPESVEELIDALPSFSDWALATAIGLDSCVGMEAYCKARLAIPRLNRVRKLLALIDDGQKPHYTAVFLRKIHECMAGYSESRKQHNALFDKSNGGITFTEPDSYHRKRAIAGALAYILTEWDCHEALPTFAQILEQPDPIPVNRLFLLYSCHVLIESLPTAGLSPARLNKLQEYKRLAPKLFPSVARVKVPAWNAKYDETDFRAVILGQRVPIESEPTLSLRIYPNIKRLEDPNFFHLREEADILQRVMLSFLRMK